jgi:hypothetical protein
MLVVLPFHAGDKAQAVSLANWIKELGQVSDHKCLLCVGENCDQTGVIEPLHEAFKSVSVYLPHAKAKRGEGIMGYARAANAMWQSVAWKIYIQDKCPWLWLEPDAIPTRPTWLREIEDEYKAFKKPFMGAMGQCQIQMINGVAVYPASVCDYAPLALQAAECPWDLNAAAQILKHAHVSGLFQHIYQINGEPPTFPKHADRLNQSAALFHRCKDSSLIAHLKQVGFTTGKNLSGGVMGLTETRSQSTERELMGAGGTSGGSTLADRAPSAQKPLRDFDPDEGLGEPVDYSQRLQEFESTQRARRPNEGERNGDLVWRNGKWHTAPMVSEKAVDRKAVMERFKHPDADPIRVGPSWVTCDKCDEEYNTSSIHDCKSLPAPGTDDGPSRSLPSDDGPKTDTGAVQPSRDDLVQEAVSVLKKLCTSPVHTSKIRKELKRQGVIRR